MKKKLLFVLFSLMFSLCLSADQNFFSNTEEFLKSQISTGSYQNQEINSLKKLLAYVEKKQVAVLFDEKMIPLRIESSNWSNNHVETFPLNIEKGDFHNYLMNCAGKLRDTFMSDFKGKNIRSFTIFITPGKEKEVYLNFVLKGLFSETQKTADISLADFEKALMTVN